jgi:hypothetical protein
MRICLLASMKNEAPHLLEWVAWHRLVGFTDIVIAQNDSDDLTLEILRCLEQIGAITFLENSHLGPGGTAVQSYQWRAYYHAAGTAAYQQSDWAMALDADEFLWVNAGGGRVGDLIDQLGDGADQIHVHWRVFGSMGRRGLQPGLITEGFVEADERLRIVTTRDCFKTLFRTACFDHAGVHRPRPQVYDPARCVTGSGVRVSREDMKESSSIDPGATRWAQVNHYRSRDPETFLLGAARGRANVTDFQRPNASYWVLSDRFAERDERLAGRAGDIRAEMGRLDKMSNGRLATLSQAAFTLWQQRIEGLKAHPETAAFLSEIHDLQDRLRGPERHLVFREISAAALAERNSARTAAPALAPALSAADTPDRPPPDPTPDRPDQAAPNGPMRVCLVATMKNEAPHLLEWVAWHRLVGFTDIVIAQNDSDDMTAETLAELDRIGVITYVDNSDMGEDGKPAASHQWRAYFRAARTAAYQSSDWAMTLDGDEMLLVDLPGGRVQDLVDRLGDPVDEIHVHWRIFGSSGHTAFSDDLMSARFTETRPDAAIMTLPDSFKTLYRCAAFDMPGAHKPRPFNTDPSRCVTGSGAVLTQSQISEHSSIDPGALRLAQVNHYRVRDPESLMMRRVRGMANVNREMNATAGYWAMSDATGDIDRRLADRAPDIRAEMDQLDALSQGRLHDLRCKAHDLWATRIAALKHDPKLRALFDEVLVVQQQLRGPDAAAVYDRYRGRLRDNDLTPLQTPKKKPG